MWLRLRIFQIMLRRVFEEGAVICQSGFIEFLFFPPLRRKKVARMGHGVWLHLYRRGLRTDALEGFDDFNFVGDFESQRFQVGMKAGAFPLWQFVSELRERGNCAAGECSEAGRICQSATDFDQFRHAPGPIGAPRYVVVGDDGIKVGRQRPIFDEMAAGLAVIASKLLCF